VVPFEESSNGLRYREGRLALGITEDKILQWFGQYAYRPMWVYMAIVTLMFLSSFGLPFPEEITLVSTGLVAYMGTRPDLYPPPFPGAPVVNLYMAAVVATLSVFLSDYLVYFLGRHSGQRLQKHRWMQKHLASMDKVLKWTSRYGMWAAGVFRFTPGLRFPGHFACGLLRVTPLQFTAIDGTAVLISVPTQVILVGLYGQTILEYIKVGKVYLGIGLAGLVLFLVGRWLFRKVRARRMQAPS